MFLPGPVLTKLVLNFFVLETKINQFLRLMLIYFYVARHCIHISSIYSSGVQQVAYHNNLEPEKVTS